MTFSRPAILRLSGRAWLAAWTALGLLTGAAAQPGPGVNGEPRSGPRQENGGGRGGVGLSMSIGDLLRGAATVAQAINAAQQDDVAYESGQLLILWPDAAQAAQGLAQLAQREQLQPAARHALDALGGELALFQFGTQAEAARWRTQLRASYPPWIIDFNARATLQQAPQWSEGGLAGTTSSAAPPSPAVPSNQARLYALRMLGLLPRPTVPIAPPGTAVRVGVIDTGLPAPLLAPAVQSRVWNGSSFVQRSVLGTHDVPAPPTHGAAVAQLLVGQTQQGTDFAGAAPTGSILWAAAMRMAGDKPSTHTLLLVQGFDWLLGQGAQLINLSAGGAGDDILKNVVAQLVARDLTLVAAAGNRPDAQPVYPAAYPGVWAVGAVDASRQRYTQGSRGDYLSLVAPGVDVWVPQADALLAAPQGAPVAGRYLSGSSFAAAMATGVLAWLPPAFWSLPRDARLKHLCKTALPTDPAQGCGLLQMPKKN